jgi:hypothetical protein
MAAVVEWQPTLIFMNDRLLAAAATTSIKYWLVNHIGMLAKCIVGVVAFVACLLPADAAQGVLSFP